MLASKKLSTESRRASSCSPDGRRVGPARPVAGPAPSETPSGSFRDPTSGSFRDPTFGSFRDPFRLLQRPLPAPSGIPSGSFRDHFRLLQRPSPLPAPSATPSARVSSHPASTAPGDHHHIEQDGFSAHVLTFLSLVLSEGPLFFEGHRLNIAKCCFIPKSDKTAFAVSHATSHLNSSTSNSL